MKAALRFGEIKCYDGTEAGWGRVAVTVSLNDDKDSEMRTTIEFWVAVRITPNATIEAARAAAIEKIKQIVTPEIWKLAEANQLEFTSLGD